MGGNVEHLYQVEHWRKGMPGFEVIATAGGVSVARAAFWGAVDARGATLHPGGEIALRHGARVILRYPPDRAADQSAPVQDV
jgi:hypothetical protein